MSERLKMLLLDNKWRFSQNKKHKIEYSVCFIRIVSKRCQPYIFDQILIFS